MPMQQLLCTEKYYQQVRGPLKSRMSALRDCATAYRTMNCQRNTHSKITGGLGFAAEQLK